MDQRAETIPGRYSVTLSLMQYYRTTYRDLMDSPEDMVAEMIERMAADNRWAEKRRRRDEARGT